MSFEELINQEEMANREFERIVSESNPLIDNNIIFDDYYRYKDNGKKTRIPAYEL